MAKFFASDRGNRNPQGASGPKSVVRETAPEQALAAVQVQADHSSTTARLTQFQSMESAPVQRRQDEEEELQMKPIQRMEDEEMLQGKAIDSTLQRREDEEEELMQGKAMVETLQRHEESAFAGGEVSGGGLPAQLQQGIEHFSGADMSGVKVHYNSSKPATVQAHAYAQGSNIHVSNGQEKHLPHEAWHVAQQRQGRVQPTTSVGGTPVNDDPALEKEADVMGAKANNFATKVSDQ